MFRTYGIQRSYQKCQGGMSLYPRKSDLTTATNETLYIICHSGVRKQDGCKKLKEKKAMINVRLHESAWAGRSSRSAKGKSMKIIIVGSRRRDVSSKPASDVIFTRKGPFVSFAKLRTSLLCFREKFQTGGIWVQTLNQRGLIWIVRPFPMRSSAFPQQSILWLSRHGRNSQERATISWFSPGS